MLETNRVSLRPMSILALITGLGAQGCSSAPEFAADETVATTGTEPSISFEEFRDQTPFDAEHGVYIVEWDRPLRSEEALREYYDQTYGPSGALLVEQSSGRDAIWSRQDRWRLSYCIDKAQFGSSYSKMVAALRRAAAAWENALDVRFPYSGTEDTNCVAWNNNVMFEVHASTNRTYDAMTMFIPTDPRSMRYIDVDISKNYDELKWTDIMTHELGHVLGFKHEHVRNPAATGVCKDDTDSYRPVTAYDSLSILHYPKCPGSQNTSGRLTISQRDLEGAQSIYDAPTNVVHCNGVLYARKRSTGELYRYAHGQGWQWFDTGEQAYVCAGIYLYAQGKNAGVLWEHFYDWKVVFNAPTGQLFGCTSERACFTDIRSDGFGGAINVYDRHTASFQTIGGPGSKFAATYNTLLGLSPKRDSVSIYNGSGQSWTKLPDGGALDLIGSGSHGQYIYRTTSDGSKLQRFTGSLTSPWKDVYSGKVRQWHHWSAWLYSIGLTGHDLYRHHSDGTRTFIDGDSVRAYTDTGFLSECLFVTDQTENIWKWCQNPGSWEFFGRP